MTRQPTARRTTRPRLTRHRAWVVVTALGVLLAVGAPVGWWLIGRPGTAGDSTGSVTTVGADAARQLAGPPDRAPSPAGAGTAPGTAPGATPGATPGPVWPTHEGRVGQTSPARPVPVRLELPSLGITATVDPVGVDPAGALQIPADVADVGWYRYGPRPGDPTGSAVFSGHVDSAEQGPGAFFRLRRINPGDPVILRTNDGRTRRYRVVAREEWPKSEVPLDRLFARSGQPRITLVTCGGGFREDIRSYTDNIAVTAVPEGRG